MRSCIFVLLALSIHCNAFAGEADVVEVKADCDAQSSCDFHVTVRHADEGWEHYADRWQVLTLDGEVLGTRELAHPHENEQPFTRSLRGVRIPDGVDEVVVQAGDSVHGYGGKKMAIMLHRNSGDPAR
jgi:hypothetical protein